MKLSSANTPVLSPYLWVICSNLHIYLTNKGHKKRYSFLFGKKIWKNLDSFILVFKNKSLFIVDKNAKMYTCRKKAMKKTVTLFLRLPWWLRCKDSGDLGSIPESGRSPGEGNVNPLQYSCLENPMDRGCKESDTTEWLTHTHVLLSVTDKYLYR